MPQTTLGFVSDYVYEYVEDANVAMQRLYELWEITSSSLGDGTDLKFRQMDLISGIIYRISGFAAIKWTEDRVNESIEAELVRGCAND